MAKNKSLEDCVTDVRDNLAVIRGCREAIEAALEEAGQLDLLTELQEAERVHGALLEELKHAARTSGSGRISLGDCDIVVATPVSQVVEDPSALIEVARRNGDYDVLVAAGVVKFDIDAKQIERLDGNVRARYAEFVTERAGTSRVTIPAALQAGAGKTS